MIETKDIEANLLRIKILPFEEAKISKDSFILVTAADYEGITELLEDNDAENINYTLSPDFANYKELMRLKEYSAKIVFTCSDYNDQKRARLQKGEVYIL